MASPPKRRTPSQRQYVPPAPPEFVPFQHAKLVHEPPSSERWLHEIKFDGYRLQVRVASGAVTVKRRSKVTPDRRAKLTPLAQALAVARRRSAEPSA